MYKAPTSPPPTMAATIRSWEAEAEELRFKADEVLTQTVTGPRGQLLTVAEAKERAEKLREAVEAEEASNSQRHRRVPMTTKILTLVVVVVVDFPIMLCLASSVFKVDGGSLL